MPTFRNIKYYLSVPILILVWIVIIHSAMEYVFLAQNDRQKIEEKNIAASFAKEAEDDLNNHLRPLLYFSTTIDAYSQKRQLTLDTNDIKQFISDYMLASGGSADSCQIYFGGNQYLYEKGGSGIKINSKPLEAVISLLEEGNKTLVENSRNRFYRNGDAIVFLNTIMSGEKPIGVIKVDINPVLFFETISNFAENNGIEYAIYSDSGEKNRLITGDSVLDEDSNNRIRLDVQAGSWSLVYKKRVAGFSDTLPKFTPWIVRISSLLVLVMTWFYFRNRRKSEENLKLYKLLSENSKDVVWVYNLDRQKYTYMSPSVLAHRGISHEEALNQKLTDSLNPESASAVKEIIAKRLEEYKTTGESKENLLEVQQMDRDGIPFWAEISYSLRPNERGEIEVIGNSRKIDSRKESELAVNRLNRELNAIALCEKSVIQSTTVNEMLDQVCNIICNNLGYSLAWAGFTKNDDDKGIEPVAIAGGGVEYVKSALLSWSYTNPRGKGPAGRAVREGKPVICQDIESEKSMAPWREMAQKYGYNSLIAIPLFNDNEVFGVLVIYSSTKNSFIESEVTFLEDLSRDLAFGVNYLQIKNDNRITRERLHNVQSMAGLFSWELDLQTDICTLYENCSLFFGENARLGKIYFKKDFLSKIESNDRILFEDMLREVSTIGEVRDVEVKIRRGNTSVEWLRNKLIPVKEGDSVKSVFVISADITKVKKMSGELGRLVVAVEQSFASVILTDTKGKIEYVNPQFTAITGYTKEEVIGMNPGILKSGLHSKEFYENLWSTILAGKQWNGVFSNKRKDGTIYHESAIISPITNEDGEVINFLAIKNDVTEKYRYERDIRLSEERFRAIVDNSITGIAIVDSDGYVDFANEATEKITGYISKDIKGSHFSKFIHPDELDNAHKILQSIVSGYKNFSIEEIKLINGNTGESTWIMLSISRYPKTDDNEKDKVLLLFQDISKHKETEIKLRQSVNTRDKMFSIISHDLRGPIGNLLPLFEMFTREDTDEEVKDELLREMKRTTATAYDLLENLLSWARFQTKSITLKAVDFDINETIADAVALYSSYVGQKSITVSVETGSKNFVYADNDSVNLVIRNIFYNAIKFTPKFGRIRLKAETIGSKVYVSVIDSGVGMSKEVASSIFNKDVFYKSYGTNNEIGTGLGLQLCKEFVLKNGGEIKVESQLGKGSKFEFSLPKGKQVYKRKKEIQQNLEQNELALSGKKILIVEDDKFNALYTRSLMDKWRLVYDSASNGREAVEKLHTNTYDLVLMDLEMPEMDGFAACKSIRASFRTSMPIIAMSANIDEDIIKNIELAGFTDYISKPINPKLLFVKIAYRLKIKISSDPDEEESETGSELKVFKYADLEKIYSSFGEDAESVKMMVGKFLEVAPGYYNDMTSGFDEGNIGLVKSEAHKLKSSIGFFTSDELDSEIRLIHEYASIPNVKKLKPLIDNFKNWFPELCEELRNYNISE